MPSSLTSSPSSIASSMRFFKKKPQPAPLQSSAYITALNQARAHMNDDEPPSPTSLPGLSLSSSLTGDSQESILDESDVENADELLYPVRPPTSEQTFTTLHTEFGHCTSEEFRYLAEYTGESLAPSDQEPPYYIVLTTYVSYLLLICMGHIRDFFGKRLYPSSYKHLMARDGYAPLTSDFDSFYTRRLKMRIDDCFAQPVTGVAGRTIVLYDRMSPDWNNTQILTGKKIRALNISSYNYLGYAQSHGGCADVVEESIKRYGVSSCGPRLEGGSSDIHLVCEKLVAQFVGQEAALISSMGFATNSTYIPALVEKGTLVISDELNHASIRFGIRWSAANVRMFKHNDMNSLEELLREVISQGQPKTHRPWKKILVAVEGLYSMEGTLVNLPVMIQLKKKYKFYLFIDEAHSIGAVGLHGRGVAEYFGIDPSEIDILMGTFTKSFGAGGGYVAGKKALIDSIRVRGYSGPYAETMSPAVVAQIIASLVSITGIRSISSGDTAVPYQHPGPIPKELLPAWVNLSPDFTSGWEGETRLRRIAFNSRYLHYGLLKLGFITYGHPISPIVPLLIFNPGKMAWFHRMMFHRKVPIIVVVVAYPATSLATSRVRFCVSASHTKEDIDNVLEACNEIGDILDLKNGIPRSERWAVEEIVNNAVALVNDPEMKL